MKCAICNEEYPSKYWFGGEAVCLKCHLRRTSKQPGSQAISAPASLQDLGTQLQTLRDRIDGIQRDVDLLERTIKASVEQQLLGRAEQISDHVRTVRPPPEEAEVVLETGVGVKPHALQSKPKEIAPRRAVPPEADVTSAQAPPQRSQPPTRIEPPVAEKARQEGLDTWEATIGSSWLNRIGVAMLVLAIAFGLGYTLTHIGTLGKASLATAVSLALLSGGLFMERFEFYRFYGRGLIGGGWAALYATAYAVHELEATRVVESPALGFVLLLCVGAGMIIHSLRYRNEGLTTLAYGLGYAAIVIHSISAYTLLAATVLGAGTMVHLVRRRWYGVALGGMAATYGSLLLWYLRQQAIDLQTLRLGLAALVIDWVVFLTADFAGGKDERARLQSRAVSLLNAIAACGLASLAWGVFSSQGVWIPLAVIGSAYCLTAAVLRRMGRMTVHQIHTLVAVLALAIAAGKGLSLTGATWFWLTEAQCMVLLGARLKDRFHRRIGSGLFLIPMLAVVIEQIIERSQHPDGAFDLPRLLLNGAACACFYLTYARLREFASTDQAGLENEDEMTRRVFLFGAFLLILLALYIQLPLVLLAPAGAVLMLLLFEISARYRWPDLRIQAYLAAAWSTLVALLFTVPSVARVAGVPARIPALFSLAAAFMAVFLRQAKVPEELPNEYRSLRHVFSWGGVALAALTVWLAARPTLVGPLWMVLALLLVEAGLALEEIHIRRPGLLLVLCSHLSLALSNLNATAVISGVAVRAATVLPAIAATYYLWWRLRGLPQRPAEGVGGDTWDEVLGRAMSYVGGIMTGLFVLFQFGLDGAAMRWAIAMVVLFYVGRRLRDADFRIQAYTLGGAVFVRAIGFDFQHASPVFGIDGPLAIACVVVASYIATGYLVRAGSTLDAAPDRRSLSIEARLRPYVCDTMWLLGLALLALYLYRTQSGSMLIGAWAVEGLAATIGGFAAGTQPLRIAGLGLLGLALALTLIRAFTTFDTLGRIISFAVLGLVLLMVSLIYTRYRHRVGRTS